MENFDDTILGNVIKGKHVYLISLKFISNPKFIKHLIFIKVEFITFLFVKRINVTLVSGMFGHNDLFKVFFSKFLLFNPFNKSFK